MQSMVSMHFIRRLEMGKKLRCFQIDFDNPQAIYFPGQPINGKVIVDLESETKVNGKNQT